MSDEKPMSDDQIVDLMKLKDALLHFCGDMAGRLWDKVNEGKSGWDDPKNYTDEDLDADIESAFERYLSGDTDELNVANYLMFKWNRKNDKEQS